MSERPEHWVRLTDHQYALSMRIAAAFAPYDRFDNQPVVEIGSWAKKRAKKARDAATTAKS